MVPVQRRVPLSRTTGGDGLESTCSEEAWVSHATRRFNHHPSLAVKLPDGVGAGLNLSSFSRCERGCSSDPSSSDHRL